MANRFTGHGPMAWTDVRDMRRAEDPNILIKAVDMAAYLQNMGDHDIRMIDRELIYRDPTTGNKYKIVCNFYVMVAASLTLHVAGTSSVEGRLLGEDGILCDGGDDSETIAGMMFPFYYSVGEGGPTGDFVETTLAVGDGIWVVRRGNVELDYSGASTAGDRIMCDAGGEVVSSAAMAGPTAAQIINNLYTGECVGRTRVDPGGAGLGEAVLLLPERYRIVT